MKRIILISMVLLTVGQISYAALASGQDTRQIQERVRRAEADNERLKRELRNLKTDLSGKLDTSNSKIDTLSSRLEASDQNVRNLNDQLGNRIASTEGHTDQKLSSLDSSINRNTLLFIVGGLALALLSGLIYFFLRRRITRDNSDLAERLTRTREALEEEGVKLDNKLIEVLSSKMQASNASGDPIRSGDSEPDHSLALKVADEIVRIEKNLNVMGPETRGLKQLAASVGRIRDNFAAKGYELVEMLNRPYDPGMKVIANFRPDENLKPDEQIITRIIKPQVNFGGVMIQAAQIEVSQGE
ncbi:MAG: hypothetical protein IPL32_17215 [Chloracidobacterium sp.]|nr:hypothetical protein [Chloracidobacterium sp.]